VNKPLNRLRRWTVTAIAATTLLSTGVILATGGIAGANITTGSTTGVTQPTIITNGTIIHNEAAGNLTLSIGNASTITAGNNEFTITTVSNSGNPIDWDAVPTFTVTAPVGSSQLCVEGQASGTGCTTAGVIPTIAGNVLTFDVDTANGANATLTNGETITVSGIAYDVPANTTVGPDFNTVLDVPQALTFSPTTHPTGTGSGDSSTNAIVSNSAGSPTATLNAVQTPAVAIGGSNQTAGSWNLLLTNPGGSGNTVISKGDTVNILVADDNGFNCDPGTIGNSDTVGFASVPNIDITAGTGAATGTPTATASLSSVNRGGDIRCLTTTGGTVDDMLTLTFTNTTPVVITTTTPGSGITIQITGVKYNIGIGAQITGDQGNVEVASNYDIAGFTTVPGGGSETGAPTGPSNADIGAITVAANTPPSDIQLNVTSITGSGSEAVNQPISPITITESAIGSLESGINGYVCVSLVEGGQFDASTTNPTAAATGGMTVGPVTVLTTGPLSGDSTLEFQVTGGSTTGPATITLSNLNVSVPQSLAEDILGGLVEVTYDGSNAACSGGVTTTTATKAFSVSARIAGTDADGTAAQAFEIANPVGGGGNLDAVLANDAEPYDALAASYLAGQLGTGILLSPTGAISAETLNALRIEGVETVYVAGGPDSISNAAIAQLEATPSFTPGGVTERYDAFTNDLRLLDVVQVYGATADGTASEIAQFVGAKPIGTPSFQGGYGGAYNDTTGSSGSPASSAPDTGVNTAILATDTGFQDAASASVMSYNNTLPLILTPPSALSTPAIAALQNDGIQQVIVTGGPSVINDSVLTQLEGMGISTIRIAGSDYTDTSVEAAKFELNGTDAAGQADGLGYSTIAALGVPAPIRAILNINVQALGFARGDFFTDALVSSQINSLLEQPELLTENPTTVGTPVTTFLNTEGNPATAYGSSLPDGSHGSSKDQYTVIGGQGIFGGTDSIPSATETAIATALGPDQLPTL